MNLMETKRKRNVNLKLSYFRGSNFLLNRNPVSNNFQVKVDNFGPLFVVGNRIPFLE
jgi:hypothetical protein